MKKITKKQKYTARSFNYKVKISSPALYGVSEPQSKNTPLGLIIAARKIVRMDCVKIKSHTGPLNYHLAAKLFNTPINLAISTKRDNDLRYEIGENNTKRT